MFKNLFSRQNLLPWVAALLVAAVLLVGLERAKPAGTAAENSLPYSELLLKAKSGDIVKVELKGAEARAWDQAGAEFRTHVPDKDPAFVTELVKANVAVNSLPLPEPSVIFAVFMSWGPAMLMIGMWVYFMRQNAAGRSGQGGSTFGKSRAKLQANAEVKTSFADVAGCDEAKEEVAELVDFLKDPGKFESLGGHIPRGVLLSGPPGTGKTLLAKAIAGEAQVPFFSLSGSDFVEMFVGVGAARVRDLFATAKKSAPCIVFIDEIDAVGRSRGAGHGGGNDEREQTLNQMLVEMDGFETGLGVIVVAATNRPEILDSALLRPGRFDRQVTVGLPDVRGREQILNVHLRKVPVSAEVSPAAVARGTPGFSGADLGNLVNEAALLAARAGRRTIGNAELDKAKDKILMGPERKSLRMSEQERSDTAYHEAGHAIVARLLPHTDPVHKVSIVPRGRALGVTVQLPETERYSLGKKRILDSIAVLFGGRVAEELFTGDITTGASNDYERATQLARNMVMRWGMSEVVGPLVVGESQPAVAGSPETLRKVDEEVRRILEEQYARVRDLLGKNAARMHAMRDALLEWETLDADQVEDIMCDRPARAPVPVVPVSAASRHEALVGPPEALPA